MLERRAHEPGHHRGQGLTRSTDIQVNLALVNWHPRVVGMGVGSKLSLEGS